MKAREKHPRPPTNQKKFSMFRDFLDPKLAIKGVMASKEWAVLALLSQHQSLAESMALALICGDGLQSTAPGSLVS